MAVSSECSVPSPTTTTTTTNQAYALYKTHGTCLKVTRVALFAFTLTLTRTLALTLALALTLTLLPQGDA